MNYQQPVDTREAPHSVSILSLSEFHNSPTLHSILVAVAEVTGVHMRDLIGLSRQRQVVDARFIFFLLARQTTGKSFPQIGRACRKDHTTVMHGAHQARIRRVEFAGKIDAILAKLERRS